MVDLYKNPTIRRNKSYSSGLNIFNIHEDIKIEPEIIEENIYKKPKKQIMFDIEAQEYIETDNVSTFCIKKSNIRLSPDSVTDIKSNKKRLKFNNNVNVCLIQQRSEIPNKNEIWWSENDYNTFRLKAYNQYYYDVIGDDIEQNDI